MTEHRIVLCKRVDALLDFLYADTHLACHCLLTCKIVWHKLVEWWVKQTDVDVATVHSLEDAVEVYHLIRQQLVKSFLATFYRVGKNHLAHGHNLLVVEEHMFCTCQADALCTEGTCHLCVMRSVGIGANLHLCVLVAEIHQFLEVA